MQEQTSSINVEAGARYPLNLTQAAVPVNIAPKGQNPHWVTFGIRRPEREQLFERERESVTETKPVAGGESIIITNDEAANIALFKKVRLTVQGLTKDKRVVEITDDVLPKIKPGYMNKAIQSYYAGEATLESWSPDMEFIDTDSSGLRRVRHELGSKEEPDATFFWNFSEPGELVRADYRLNSLQVRTGGGGRRAKSKLVTDLKVAIRTFSAIFQGVEGAVLLEDDGQGGYTEIEYSPARRDEFLAAIDPILMAQAIAPVMEVQEGNLSD